MRVKRSIIGTICALACLLVAVFATGAAQASTPAAQGAGGRIVTVPSAPQGAQPASAPAATSPSISPAVRTQHVPAGGSFSCGDGNFCTAVWDPTTSDWKIFFLYTCRKYALSYWSGQGAYYNQQTGNVTSYLYDRNSNVLVTSRPDGGILHNQDWSPVWYIRNC
ncbi:hypothetical protein [Streptomyces sp. MST-110588]|uniref:hypothetical protein n=1 Tax=Streptomyces sp. MST-110588 TaxID=2833628 RepID=UPI001F5D86E9|nr:hypothetical protein [Streptomyces sp. MST-110588]UNO38416.1 hypothetical protein KGS77_00555 [Streptomyces sp. MST-110588]